MIEISQNELIQVLNKVIKKIQEDNITEYLIDNDYYWIVSTDEWSDFDTAPQPIIGSLNDDWGALQNAIKDNFLTYVDYDRTSSILRAISQAINPV